MSTTAHLETIAGIVRIFRDGKTYGDPYDVVMTIVGHENVAIIKGLQCEEALRPDGLKALQQCLKASGFTVVEWTRHRHGETSVVRIEL